MAADEGFCRAIHIDGAFAVEFKRIVAMARGDGVQTRFSSTGFADIHNAAVSSIDHKGGVALKICKAAHIFITISESGCSGNQSRTLTSLVAGIGDIFCCIKRQGCTAAGVIGPETNRTAEPICHIISKGSVLERNRRIIKSDRATLTGRLIVIKSQVLDTSTSRTA